ncbi:MAG: DUF2309 domain-containing protein [Zoogloeaceae bacterium]|nr:DUF2309 domain-containing protein [Zoogloeaceae bacterium]
MTISPSTSLTPAAGRHLRVRALAYVAGEPVPFFWPMRSFIHHNPLHGLEHLPFATAVEKGAKLFHARGFLPRHVYQGYLADGRIDAVALATEVERFVAMRAPIETVDLKAWLTALLREEREPVIAHGTIADVDDVHAALHPGQGGERSPLEAATLIPMLRDTLLGDRPVQEAVDALCGTAITAEINESVIRVCLDFFDEGQSVWVMPDREQGLFTAWRRVAGREMQRLLDAIAEAESGADGVLTPEMVIDHILRRLEVPETHWIGYFTREIAQLHGWAGFIRWRATASHYHWSERYPGDLVDLLAIRLSFALLLLTKRVTGGQPKTRGDLERLIESAPHVAYLRRELHCGRALPALVQRVEDALLRRDNKLLGALFVAYAQARRVDEAATQLARLRALAQRAGQQVPFESLGRDALAALIDALRDFEKDEGMIWLRAMETRAMQTLLAGLSLDAPPPREKRPFVQAAFCIDTRSERIRRHLESVGDYQTFGVAGFFGVPVSLIELGKGSETHLCPVLLTPKNVVLEMSSAARANEAAVTALGHAMHKLKESVLSPFVTVEAIGLLFGFDMIGKTVAPRAYNHWRRHLHEHKSGTHLLLDKLSREQADSILRAVQRAIIVEAVEHELGLPAEKVNDALVRALREAALGHAELAPEVIAELGVPTSGAVRFIDQLRGNHRINAAFSNRQMEELGRIGFTIDEQVRFVRQALSSIGLTGNFSRFVLLAGHGSTSENNPYESALDCGACGGNHGLISARVLAQMANKPAVRKRLAEKGIEIPDDTWFMPALHNTTTDEITLHDLELLPTSHLVYLDRLRTGLNSAARLCAQERLPSLQIVPDRQDPGAAFKSARRNAMDWSQVRPEWGLSRNAYFIIGRRDLTRSMGLDGRAFLHSYDYRVDPKRRLLENILTGPLVVGQWINMEHYFSAVDNERFGSGSKVYHNVAGRFGVMTGNLSDLRTGLPSQTVLENGQPYHEPMRLITVIEAPFEQARAAVEAVVSVKRLVRNGWIRLIVIDPETATVCLYEEDGSWRRRPHGQSTESDLTQERCAS